MLSTSRSLLRRPSLSSLLALVLLAPAASTSASADTTGDWTRWRGPHQTGAVAAPGTFTGAALAETGVALETVWNRKLGSGYSGISVLGDLVLTMFCDDESDWLVALKATNGEEAWRVKMGPKTKGLSGADDGPLSTPVADAERIYALGAKGLLVAVSPGDGKNIWSLDLAEKLGAEPPYFGFAAAPLVLDDLLIVTANIASPEATEEQAVEAEAKPAAPGEGANGDPAEAEEAKKPPSKAVVGVDKRTGQLRWTAAEGDVDYQSPALVELAGRRQVLVELLKTTLGLDPATGEVLWTLDVPSDGSASPQVIGGDRFLTLGEGEAYLHRLKSIEGGFEAELLWKSSAFKGNVATPVYHEGHLYGFNRQILVCVDAATGKEIWKSREPGGRGLILVDGHLVIFGAKGDVAVAEATPEGYRETARTKVSETDSYTAPSFAGGLVFVRNLTDIAALRPVAASATEAKDETASEGAAASGR